MAKLLSTQKSAEDKVLAVRNAGLIRKAFKPVPLLIVCALIAGCSLIGSKEDAFVSLHAKVQSALNVDSDCGLVRTNEVIGGRYFEVAPRRGGLVITVAEKRFFSQREWDRRYTQGTNQMYRFLELTMTKTNPSSGAVSADQQKLSAGITNFFGLSELPDWWYRDIGVDVNVQQVDEANPNAERDGADAQERVAKIGRFLMPYH